MRVLDLQTSRVLLVLFSLFLHSSYLPYYVILSLRVAIRPYVELSVFPITSLSLGGKNVWFIALHSKEEENNYLGKC